jgi:alpha-beta hydrolase superfamily lysophospholipase
VRVTAVPTGGSAGTTVATAAAAPESLADLLATQDDLEGPAGEPDRVRVVQVPQADGSSAWVVVVPGTQDWSARAGPNPADLTSDVLLMAQQETLLAAGVERALESAQQEAGRAGRAEPVLLAGHSQGGIVAAALAADPLFRRRQRVTHVVASGAPIARMPVPADISVLALEHRQDAVPRLEGERNADRRGWITVTRDLRGSEVRTAGAAHAVARYRDTAVLVDASGAGSASRSLAAWKEGSAAFLAGRRHGPPTVRDFRVERVGPAP